MGANQNARKLLSTDLVNTNKVYSKCKGTLCDAYCNWFACNNTCNPEHTCTLGKGRDSRNWSKPPEPIQHGDSDNYTSQVRTFNTTPSYLQSVA